MENFCKGIIMLQKEITVSGFYSFKSYPYYSKTFKCWHLYQKYQSAENDYIRIFALEKEEEENISDLLLSFFFKNIHS
jgi:hypothetical protein